MKSNKNEENITNWIKIEKIQDGNSTMKFTINTTKITNYNEISNAEILYLYIKEVAIKGGNQSIAISNPMKLETEVEVETYLNNTKIDNNNAGNHTTNTYDNTIAGSKLPIIDTKLVIKAKKCETNSKKRILKNCCQ